MIYFSASNSGAKVCWLWIFAITSITRASLDTSDIFKLLKNIRPSLRTFEVHYKKESALEKLVKLKIKSLKPFLQDNEKGNVDDEDESAIIEFLPPSKKTLRENVKKDAKDAQLDIGQYNKMKKKIIKALHKEPISDKTKYLVNKTLEQLMGHLLRNECVWKTRSEANVLIDGKKKLQLSLPDDWNQKWGIIKKSDSPFGKLYEYFTNLLYYSDAKGKNPKYRLKCEVINDKYSRVRSSQAKHKKMQLKENHGNHQCKHFKVCSNELKKFMLDFYYSLNNTVINTIRNYAEMYIRDVSTVSKHERSTVYSVINGISQVIERKLNRTFRRETSNFKLDKKKNSERNIEALKMYVVNIIGLMKNKTDERIRRDILTLNPNFRNTIEKDISVNLEVDLRALEKNLIKSICPTFEVCNNKYGGRRENLNNKEQNVQVKLQLTLDDDLKALFKKPNRRTLESANNQTMLNLNNTQKSSKLTTQLKYYGITRTGGVIITNATNFKMPDMIATTKKNTIAENLMYNEVTQPYVGLNLTETLKLDKVLIEKYK